MPQHRTKLPVGYRSGRLTVVGEAEMRNGQTQFLCKCDCGGEITASGTFLKRKVTLSCGSSEDRSFLSGSLVHGMSRTKFHRTWMSMLSRCHNVKQRSYKNYGGRGIKVDPRWMTFEGFSKDMLVAYNEHVAIHGERNTTIERKDNDGNYEPGNVRWATYKEQIENRRNSRTLTLNGKTQSLEKWAKETGINAKAIFSRIYLGWSDERILTTPVRFRKSPMKK